MSAALAAMVEETTETIGTGTLSLSGPTAQHRGFLAGFGALGTCHYTLLWGNHWEYGIGTFTDGTPDTLSRDLIINSSFGSSQKINLGIGIKLVYCEIPPECYWGNGFLEFAQSDASPSVRQHNFFRAANAAPTTITLFDDGLPGQEISILCTNSNTTFFHNVLRHPGGTDITPSANDIITYVKPNTNWHLVAWSQNG
jgi:hypothetical protein